MAVIINPIYSKPAIALSYNAVNDLIGSINVANGTTILREGNVVNKTAIVEKDVVYQVSDIYNTQRYVSIFTDMLLSAKITNIAPNKLSPQSIGFNNNSNQVYYISQEMDISKINNSAGAYNINDIVNVLFEKDGKILYMY
jgi:hypothetical protein